MHAAGLLAGQGQRQQAEALQIQHEMLTEDKQAAVAVSTTALIPALISTPRLLCFQGWQWQIPINATLAGHCQPHWHQQAHTDRPDCWYTLWLVYTVWMYTFEVQVVLDNKVECTAGLARL